MAAQAYINHFAIAGDCGPSGQSAPGKAVPENNRADDHLLTFEELCRRLRLSKRKIQLDMAAGAIAYVKLGRATRFKPADVDAYIEARRVSRRHRFS